MTKNPNDPIIPPVKDLNGNGYLDADDLMVQMAQEEKNGGARDPSEKAHGLLESVKTRQLARVYNLLVLTDRDGPTTLANMAKILKTELDKTVVEMNSFAQQHPTDAKEVLEADLRKKAAKDEDPEELKITIADKLTAFDFARSFAATFPKGIKIEADDMRDLMSHFESLYFPTPHTPAQKKDPIVTQTI